MEQMPENLIQPAPQPEQTAPNPPPCARVSLRPIYAVLTGIAGIILGVGGFFAYSEYLSDTPVTSYEECIQANGSQTNLLYPATCTTKDGKVFTQPSDGTDDPGLSPEKNPIESCSEDADCIIALDNTSCCPCPQPVHMSALTSTDRWIAYEPDNINTFTMPEYCSPDTTCSCEQITHAICTDNHCVGESDTSLLPGIITQEERARGWYWGNADQKKGNTPDSWVFLEAGRSSAWHAPDVTPLQHAYTCPETEWIDCMPGAPQDGIKPECAPDYLNWAKLHCPGFRGAAL